MRTAFLVCSCAVVVVMTQAQEPEPSSTVETNGTSTVRIVLPSFQDDSRRSPNRTIALRSIDRREPPGYFQSRPISPSGIAVFSEIPAGTYVAYGWKGGQHDEPSMSFSVDAGKDLTITLPLDYASLHGQIMGVEPDVKEQYLGWFARDPVKGAVTQGVATFDLATGAYEITGLLPGRYRLIYGGPNIMHNEFYTVVEPGINRFDGTLPVGRIDGRLVDIPYPRSDASSVGHIRVSPSGTTTMSGNLVTFLHADINGMFTLRHVRPGRYVVHMRDKDSTEIYRQVVTIDSESDIVPVELRPSAKLGRLEGRVTGYSANETAPLRQRGLSIALVPREEYGYEFAVGHWGRADFATGKFNIKAIPEGTYGIKVGGVGAVPNLWLPNVSIRADTVRTIDLSIPAWRAVSISVQGAHLNPKKRVWYIYMDGTRTKYDYFVGSGPTGLVAGHGPFGLPYGDYLVEADFGDGIKVQRPLHVGPGDEVLGVTLRHPDLDEGGTGPN